MRQKLLKNGWCSACLIAAVSVFTGCLSEPTPTIQIGMNAWPGYEFVYLASEKGFYAEEGVNVRVVEFSSLADARRAYERGKIDAFATTVIEVLQARDDSARTPQIVQVVDASEGADVILAQSGIPDVAGLRGKRVGVELASLGVYFLARALEKNGLSLSDVEPVSMDQISMESAFRNGELDAIVTYPPVSVNILRDGVANKVFSSADIPGEVIDVIAVEAHIVEERPEDVERILRAYHRAIEYAQDHRDEAYSIMAAREGITPEEFDQALTEGIRLFSASDQNEYLRPDGKLSRVIDKCDQVLRETRQIVGPDRRAGAYSARFVQKTAFNR